MLPKSKYEIVPAKRGWMLRKNGMTIYHGPAKSKCLAVLRGRVRRGFEKDFYQLYV